MENTKETTHLFIVSEVFNEEVKSEWGDYDIEGIYYVSKPLASFDDLVKYMKEQVEEWIYRVEDDWKRYYPNCASIEEFFEDNSSVLPEYHISYIDKETHEFFKKKGLSVENNRGVLLCKLDISDFKFEDNKVLPEPIKGDIIAKIIHPHSLCNGEKIVEQINKLDIIKEMGII
mgnify:CR=1 FL=1|jgi:hypothetical protein